LHGGSLINYKVNQPYVVTAVLSVPCRHCWEFHGKYFVCVNASLTSVFLSIEQHILDTNAKNNCLKLPQMSNSDIEKMNKI
jgi:hypothetical protein